LRRRSAIVRRLRTSRRRNARIATSLPGFGARWVVAFAAVALRRGSTTWSWPCLGLLEEGPDRAWGRLGLRGLGREGISPDQHDEVALVIVCEEGVEGVAEDGLGHHEHLAVVEGQAAVVLGRADGREPLGLGEDRRERVPRGVPREEPDRLGAVLVDDPPQRGTRAPQDLGRGHPLPILAAPEALVGPGGVDLVESQALDAGVAFRDGVVAIGLKPHHVVPVEGRQESARGLAQPAGGGNSADHGGPWPLTAGLRECRAPMC
jgi:catechol 2,3-dioxygenase-like lactoylglutathione lyase family enzyme